jgi:hypothetical protein
MVLAVCGADVLGADDAPINLEFSIERLELPGSIVLGQLRLGCAELKWQELSLNCEHAFVAIQDSPLGPATVQGKATWQPIGGGYEFVSERTSILRGSGRLELSGRGGAHSIKWSLSGIDLSRLPDRLAEIVPFIAAHEIKAGRADIDIECRSADGVVAECSVAGVLEAFDMNGANVAEGAAISFAITASRTPTGRSLRAEASIRHGAVYIEPGFVIADYRPGFFISPQAEPVQVGVSIDFTGDGSRLTAAHLRAPGVLDVSLSGSLALGPEFDWQAIDLEIETRDLAAAYATYLQPMLLHTAFASLEIEGSITAVVRGVDGAVESLNVELGDIHIDDENGRFAWYGLHGDVRLHDRDVELGSSFGWRGASIYGVDVGAGRVDWASQRGHLRVKSWLDVAIYDGEFHIDTFEIVGLGSPELTLVLSGTLTPVTLSSVTEAFGWPPLFGKISGVIPRLSYSAGRVSLGGDLEIQVFDGLIRITALEIDKLLSTVPVLQSDVEIDGLSLESLTNTFSFGTIEGRLDGRIDGLRLEAWEPISFDAVVYTPLDDPTPHRISRQAVNNLGRLGSGASSVVTQGWLKFIPSYSYGRLGVGCRLANGYCEISGVADAEGDGFYLLTRGSGLPPWIDIKGAGRRIPWQTLVDGLQQISEGRWELDFGKQTRTLH